MHQKVRYINRNFSDLIRYNSEIKTKYMKPTVYEIRTYDLIGKTIRVYEEREDLTFIENKVSGNYFVGEDGRKVESNRYYQLTTSLDNDKNLLKLEDFPVYLPYFADVTEDLPNSIRKHGIEPKTYRGCQLLTQKHGGYLEFFHHESETTLRIAINSNIYSPCL